MKSLVIDQSCGHCAHFENHAHVLEQSLPGIKTMSSAYASVRVDDGLCELHDRYVTAHASCTQFLQIAPKLN